ncbi:MAG: c-type cytochrome [Candidatus Marinarcus sp.]|uniref:c-type cytochrome n=1 Tax=Candidatus Marinarcus sp. TaxID=3100987 RepID=UPI003AFF957F
MKTIKLLAGAVIACGLSVCANADEYTQGEIYTAMCQKCHGQYAEGNPAKKGPSLIGKTKEELSVDIYELESGGYQSSGSGHDIMEYNLGVIENKGMKVNPDKMAEYIYTSFGKK